MLCWPGGIVAHLNDPHPPRFVESNRHRTHDVRFAGDELHLEYAQRRHAKLRLRARMLLAAVVVGVIALLPTLFWLIRTLVAWLTEGWGLRWREQGLMLGIGYIAAVCVLFWAARRLWRYAFFLPRSAQIACAACAWSGPCLVSEIWS